MKKEEITGKKRTKPVDNLKRYQRESETRILIASGYQGYQNTVKCDK